MNDEDALNAVMMMVPEPIVFADGNLHYDEERFAQISKYYIKTSKDQIISLETQNKYIERQQVKGVYELQTGHSPFLTRPAQLADMLMQINNQLTK